MKINSTFRVLVFLIILLIFSMSLVTFAQPNTQQTEVEAAAVQNANDAILEVKAAAEKDASSDFNLFLWGIVGGGGVVASGIIGAVGGLAIGGIVDPAQGCEIISAGMTAGCVAGWTAGVAAPLYGIYKYQTEVPAARLIGKSPEHIEIYVDAYRKKMRGLRTTSTFAGGITITGLLAAILLLTD